MSKQAGTQNISLYTVYFLYNTLKAISTVLSQFASCDLFKVSQCMIEINMQRPHQLWKLNVSSVSLLQRLIVCRTFLISALNKLFFCVDYSKYSFCLLVLICIYILYCNVNSLFRQKDPLYKM